MRRFRHLLLLRAVLIVLLAWTGADLLVPELCANEAPIPGVTADTNEAHGPATAATTEAPTRTPDSPMPAQPAPDDCFCCSQTVDTVRFDLTLGAPTSLPLTDAPAPRFSPGVLRELFHPPLSL